jgi:hypothetical protein
MPTLNSSQIHVWPPAPFHQSHWQSCWCLRTADRLRDLPNFSTNGCRPDWRPEWPIDRPSGHFHLLPSMCIGGSILPVPTRLHAVVLMKQYVTQQHAVQCTEPAQFNTEHKDGMPPATSLTHELRGSVYIRRSVPPPVRYRRVNFKWSCER